LNPDKEYWFFLFDSNHNQRGTCALLYVPEETDQVNVNQQLIEHFFLASGRLREYILP